MSHRYTVTQTATTLGVRVGHQEVSPGYVGEADGGHRVWRSERTGVSYCSCDRAAFCPAVDAVLAADAADSRRLWSAS